MDISEEMSDESPCLIVPDSQASENGGESSDVLKGLTILQPTSNVLSKSLDQMGGSDSSDSVLPNSSSSEAHSHDTSSLTSSKDDSSGEKQEATKEHALYVRRSKQADNITRQNMFRTSTPMIQSDLPPVQGIDHLTPVHVEDTSATPTSQTEEFKAKETSSSDDFVTPTLDLVVPKSSAKEADKSEIAQDKTSMTSQASKDVALSNQERSQQDTHHERQEKTSTDTFQCLQLSGECKTKGSSDDDILPSSELLQPGSPTNQIGEVIEEKTNAEEHKNCEQREATEMTDINNDQRGSTLPRWQQHMTRPDRVSPVIATLTRTSSDVSTISSREVSPQESSLRQWQSSGNDSDCDMFKTDHHESLPPDSLPKTGTQQGSSVPQHSHFKGLSLPELSEDIFQHKPKGVTAEKPIQEKDSCHGDDRSTMGNILEPSPTDDVILSSQDDVFCLHLTQSQASTTASQARSQPDRLTSLLDIETRGTTDKEGNTVNNITPPAKEGKILNAVTPPWVTLSNTILAQTPTGHPSTTGHHRDITGNQTNTGQTTRESPELTRESISEPSDLAELTREENISHPSDFGARADSKMNESTESIESGLVGFHFSPPAMLLRPVPRTSPPCLDTNSETIQDRSQEIASTTEFRPVSPDLMTTSPDLVTTISEPTVPTLSLSVPVPSEENTDEQGFSLLKDVLDVDKIATLPTPSARCIFTNVRERLQPARASSPDDEIDPFEFRDEVYTPPLSKRKRKSRYEERSGAKKRKSQDTGGINRSNDGQVWENYGTRCRESNLEQRQSSKERFWKIVKTNIITTTTTIIETQTEIIYTAQDGAVITMKRNTEFSEPIYKITTNENETREDVDVIPSQITFSCSRNTEETPHGEASTSTNNRKSTASVQRHSNISHVKAPANSNRATALKQSVQGNSMPTISKQARQSKECDIRNPKVAQPTNEKDVSETAESSVNELSKSKSAARLNKESDLRSSNVVQATKDNDIIILDSSESSVNELSKSASTPSTVSPPLFPASLNSTSSISSPDENTSSTEGKTETLPRKQTTNNATSLPKQKRKRPLSVDNRRTSRRSSTSPRIPHVLHEGTRVLALWYDKHYYPGHVVCKCNNDTKYHIEFDDGNQSDIQEECIVVAEDLPCDQPVMFCEKTGGEYIDGVIRGFYKDGDDRGYKVLGADKTVVRCPRSNVMLSTEQAAIFLSLRDSMMIVQVSLESLDNNSTLNDNEPRQNIIKTVRRSHEKGTKKSQSDQKDAPNEPRRSCEQRTKKSRSSHEDAPTGPLTDRDTNTKGKAQGKRRGKDIVKIVPEKDSGVSAIKKRSRGGENNKKVLSESSSKKRGEENVNVLPDNNDSTKKVRETAVKHQNSSASETPKSSHKSTGKKSATNNLENGGSKDIDVHVSHVRRRLSTVMNDPLEKTRRIPTRTSPRKLNSRVARNENLILPTNKDLFRGYGFILTGSDVTSVPDEYSPQEEEQVFIRDDVIAQIKTGGGEVLNKFLEDYPARDSCFLLSNGCQTTAKYFYALVLGVPCLSHAWVRDCCAENSLVSVKNYLLPAGTDLITEHLVEEQNYKDALRGLKVHLVGEDGFKQQWSEVLTAAGCEIVQKLPTNILQKLQHGDNEFVCDVIVVGNGHVAHSTIQKARLLSIPTVTIHWVKQCILTGTRVDFNAHESFIYRVQGK